MKEGIAKFNDKNNKIAIVKGFFCDEKETLFLQTHEKENDQWVNIPYAITHLSSGIRIVNSYFLGLNLEKIKEIAKALNPEIFKNFTKEDYLAKNMKYKEVLDHVLKILLENFNVIFK